MQKIKDLSNLLDLESDELQHGDSKHGNINKNGYIYHITQQCWNHRNYYSFESARYRDSLLKKSCSTHNVSLILNMIMPNHTHEVLYAKEFSDIQKIYRVLNAKTSSFITNDRRSVFGKETPRTFQNRPSYTVIENRNQLFYLIYYLYHNPDYLIEANKPVPYSCFDIWKQKNYKGYNLRFFQELFDMNIDEIMEKCSKLTKEEYRFLGNKLFKRYEISDLHIFTKI